MATPQEKVDNWISNSLVMVFSKSTCPFCIKIKQLFLKLKIKIEVLELDQIADGSAIQAALAKKTGQQTVPNVFIKGNHIGGCNVTLKLHDVGKLVPMVSSPHSGDKMATPQEKVDNLISNSLVMVFSKSTCPFCIKIKQLFLKLKIKIEVLELDQIADGSAIQAALAEKTGQRTLPNVFIKGNHIGGCNVTLKLHDVGKLVPMVFSPQGGC